MRRRSVDKDVQSLAYGLLGLGQGQRPLAFKLAHARPLRFFSRHPLDRLADLALGALGYLSRRAVPFCLGNPLPQGLGEPDLVHLRAMLGVGRRDSTHDSVMQPVSARVVADVGEPTLEPPARGLGLS